MKQKILASIAASLVIFGGVITPAFSLLSPQFNVSYVEAAEPEPKKIDSKPPVCGDGFTCTLMTAISEVIMFVPISLATISGMVFDYSVYTSIQSGTYTKYDGDGTSEGFVVSGWKLVRDFTNLVFIFALFVIAFTLILDLDGGATVSMTSNPKRTLARVLMMALLVNFSFFLGRVVIDTTNKLSLQFYTKMSNAPQITAENSVESDVNKFYTSPGNEGIRSIATGIINKINPQSFFLDKSGSQTQFDAGGYSNLFFFSFVAAFFGLFLAYIFLSIAILFVGRTIGLYLSIIISPLAFVSYTIPFLQKQPYIGFDDWMKQFMGLAFMAPLFLFFIYIGTQFFNIPLATSAGSANSLSVAASVFFKFAMIAMFFTLAKKISKDMSGKIGDMATGIVTGAATSVFTIGAAAATGGASAALVATRRQAVEGLTNASNRVFGSEKTAAFQQRMTGLKNFGSLRSDPRAALAGLATGITGSSVPGKINASITEGQVLGEKINRVNNIKNIREERLAAEAAEEARKKRMAPIQAAIDAKKLEKAKGGTPATLGDGRANAPEFTQTQKERYERKLKENQDKIAAQTPAPSTPTNAPTTTTPPPNNPPTGGTSPIKPPTPPAGDGTARPKNVFSGNADFDRPAETKPSGLVDQYGNPISSGTLANNEQKAESQKMTALYNQEKEAEGETVHVDNLAVKNLTVEPNKSARVVLPSRNNNASVTPQTQATTLLSGIQMAPRASSGAMNYKAGDFGEKKAAMPSQGDIESDPEFQKFYHEQLKVHDKEYYDKNYSGISNNGYLLDKQGVETNNVPSHLAFRTKDGKSGFTSTIEQYNQQKNTPPKQ